MHDSRFGRCQRATTLGEHAGMGAPVVECEFPSRRPFAEVSNVPQTQRTCQMSSTRTRTTAADDLGRLRRGYWLSPCVSRELWFGCTVSLRWKRVCNKIES